MQDNTYMTNYTYVLYIFLCNNLDDFPFGISAWCILVTAQFLSICWVIKHLVYKKNLSWVKCQNDGGLICIFFMGGIFFVNTVPILLIKHTQVVHDMQFLESGNSRVKKLFRKNLPAFKIISYLHHKSR